MTRLVALILAYFFLAMAIVGMFLPVLPTVPFLLLAAWFAARGSDRLHGWLYAHPHLGRLLIDWEQQRAVSRTSKVVAVLMLIVSYVVIYNRVDNLLFIVVVAVLFFAVATFLVSRPEPGKVL
ncbi:MAG: YbaN family protein [Deferrisomatales bacterium]|nr:YbaN family protein [Deferrisomatales bacterium]